jgi:hypothetical protein
MSANLDIVIPVYSESIAREMKAPTLRQTEPARVLEVNLCPSPHFPASERSMSKRL